MIRPRLLPPILATGLLLAAGPAPAPPPGQNAQEGQDAPPACHQVEGFHKLDFWLGEWEVVAPDGTLQGTNRIEKVLSGCAIMEHWEGAGGSTGKSLFFYDHLANAWKQVWVTSRATAVGGLKEKRLVEELADGGLRFQGVVVLPDGRSMLDRTTLTPLEGGDVRQVIEYSANGGVDWEPLFTGIYRARET